LSILIALFRGKGNKQERSMVAADISDRKFETHYPRANKEITVENCLGALRFSDYCQWTGATVGSWGYGFLVGRPARFHMAGLMAAIGFTFGSLFVLQNTRGRLMGFRENSREIKLYGKSDQPLGQKLDWKEYN
jgi:NADH-ubiquinone oxidoreductase complex I, 21 kDa subunit